MSAETKPAARVGRWRISGQLMAQLATLTVVAINGLVVLARSAAQDARKESRESREWYNLYRDVMVNQQQQSWAPLRSDPSAALRSGDIWCAIRASETSDRKLIDQLAD